MLSGRPNRSMTCAPPPPPAEKQKLGGIEPSFSLDSDSDSEDALSMRRCEECHRFGYQLVLMKKGRVRAEGGKRPICSQPLSLEVKQSSFRPCCMKLVRHGCMLACHLSNVASP
mmetsp:Transcript_2077/g.4506  ORF Transcript_2077/g.4506 Transcript_2077/m.4506 type:complete len:114 (-) Transcript_2077:109-450(-)